MEVLAPLLDPVQVLPELEKLVTKSARLYATQEMFKKSNRTQ